MYGFNWCKKFNMNRSQQNLEKERLSRCNAVNVESASDGDLQVLTRSTMNMRISDANKNYVINRSKKRNEGGRSTGNINGKESKDYEINCKCSNCQLGNLTDCGVCFETLQGRLIKSCPVCDNIICLSCSDRLKICAFCRSDKPPQRNRALERFIDRLILPCKNSRLGCKLLLNGDSRPVHESMCNFATIACPVSNLCNWRNTVATVQSHLHHVHNLQPLHDRGISIQIHNFRNKAHAPDGRVYKMCLRCYEQLFVIRVVLSKGRLRLCFTRLGCEQPQPLNLRLSFFSVLLTVKAHGGQGVRHLVPFHFINRDIQEVNIECDTLYPKSSNQIVPNTAVTECVQPRVTCKDDLVKIELLVIDRW